MSQKIKLRNGTEASECLNCYRNWDVVKHASNGLCRGCARMKQHVEAKPPQKWSRDFDKCQNSNCPNTINGITSQPHNAEGLCRSCYSTKQRYVDLEHSHKVEAARRVILGFTDKQKVHHHKYYEENKEQYIKNTTRYAREHIEEQRIWNANYRKKNYDKCLASCRKHWRTHLEQEHARRKDWRQHNKEVVRQYNRLRRARLAGAEGEFTLEEWQQCLAEHNNQCYHCHCIFTDVVIPTPDHLIPIIKGGTNFISNIAPLCGKCNSSKCGRDLEQFDPEYFRTKKL